MTFRSTNSVIVKDVTHRPATWFKELEPLPPRVNSPPQHKISTRCGFYIIFASRWKITRTVCLFVENGTMEETNTAQALFEAVALKDYESLLQLFGHNARQAISSYLSMQERWNNTCTSTIHHQQEQTRSGMCHTCTVLRVLYTRRTQRIWVKITSNKFVRVWALVVPSLSPVIRWMKSFCQVKIMSLKAARCLIATICMCY